MSVVTADIFDAHHAIVGVCDVQFRSFGKRVDFFGPCATLRVAEDHVPLRVALSEPGEGRVLVVDAGGMRVGVFGDQMAERAIRNGWAGVVIFGAMRDSATINELDIGVKAVAVTARRCLVATEGERDVVVSFGGVSFATGDWVYADADSVVRSPVELVLE